MLLGNFKRAATAAFFAVALAIVVAGCGPEDETVQTQKLPPVNVKKIDVDEIKPIPQAPKFTGIPREVAESIDRFVQAFNDGDAKYLCTKGYVKEDLAVLDKDGTCAKGLKRVAKTFGGYQLVIEEIRVKGDVARVKTRVVTRDLSKSDSALAQPIGLKFVKQDGEWRMSINAAQSVQNAQPSGQTGPTK